MKAVCAEKPKSHGLLTAASALFFGGLTALSLWLLATGDLPDKAVGLFGAAYGALLALCALYQLLRPLPPRYCLEGDTLRFGEEYLSLFELRSARVERRPACPFLKGTLVELALVLEEKSGKALALPLTYPGWEAVYEALRERRPDLGLGPWWEDPRVLAELVQGRGALALPRGARVVRENFHLGVLCAFLIAVLLLPLAVVLLPFPAWVRDNVALFATPIAFLIYGALVRKRLVIETKEGAREGPERPAS